MQEIMKLLLLFSFFLMSCARTTLTSVRTIESNRLGFSFTRIPCVLSRTPTTCESVYARHRVFGVPRNLASPLDASGSGGSLGQEKTEPLVVIIEHRET